MASQNTLKVGYAILKWLDILLARNPDEKRLALRQLLRICGQGSNLPSLIIVDINTFLLVQLTI